MDPVAVPFVTQVMSATDAGRRNEREVRALAEIVGRAAVGDAAGAGDVAVQRLKSVLHVSRKEQKEQAAACRVTRHAELIPDDSMELFSRQERREAAKQGTAEQQLDRTSR